MSQSENIRVSILDPESEVSTVRVDGVVDTITCKEVERAIEGLISRDKHRIVMDLAGVDYISSAGWGVFISHLKEARANSGDLRLAGMIPNVQEIFELLEFDTILNNFQSASQAAQSFQNELPDLEGGPRAPSQTSNGGLDELAAIGVDTPPPDLGAEAFSSESPSQPAQATAGPSKSQSQSNSQSNSPQDALLELIVSDPFATISELSDSLSQRQFGAGGAQTGWFWVFRTLWKQGLLSKRSRFKLARRNSLSK